MPTISHLELAALHRSGGRSGQITWAERWTWDFVVDGVPLHTRVGAGDVVGALGWGDQVWEAGITAKLLGRAEPDLPPDRVALYVCPECGDLRCGAVTASIGQAGGVVTGRNFAWQRDWDAPNAGQPIALAPSGSRPARTSACSPVRRRPRRGRPRPVSAPPNVALARSTSPLPA